MPTRFRNTVVMATILALLAGFVYFYEIRGREAREEAERAARRLLDFEADEARRLTLETEEGTIALERGDDGWRIVEPVETAADEGAVDSLLSRLGSAEKERLVAEEPEELGRYGLEEPGVRVSVELEDGSRRGLAVGRDTPVGYNVYVRRDDEDAVYLTGAGLRDSLDKSLFDLRDKRILTFTEDEVSRLEVRTADLRLAVRRHQEEDGDTWELTSPLQARADADTIDELLRDLRTDRAKAFVADGADEEALRSYGLAEPAVTVTLWTAEDISQRLQLGGKSEEPEGYYARRDGSDAVFVVPASLVEDLPRSVDDLRNRTVVDVRRDRVTAIEIDHRGEHYRLQKAGTDWRITAPRELEADASAVSLLLTDLLDLRARGFAPGTPETAAYGLGDPDLSVTLHLEEPAPTDAEGEDEAEADEEELEAAEEEPEAVEERRRAVVVRFGAATTVAAEEDEGDENGEVAARYAAASGDTTVYVVAEEDLEDLRVDLFGLRAKTLVRFTQSDVTRLEIDRGGTRYALERSDDEWEQVEPEEGPVETSPVSDVLWDLNYLRMEQVAAEWEPEAPAPALEPYGLKTPAYRVRAYAGEELVADVRLGDEVPEEALGDLPEFAPREQVYAMVGDRPGVFRIAERLRNSLRDLLEELGPGS